MDDVNIHSHRRSRVFPLYGATYISHVAQFVRDLARLRMRRVPETQSGRSHTRVKVSQCANGKYLGRESALSSFHGFF